VEPGETQHDSWDRGGVALGKQYSLDGRKIPPPKCKNSNIVLIHARSLGIEERQGEKGKEGPCQGETAVWKKRSKQNQVGEREEKIQGGQPAAIARKQIILRRNGYPGDRTFGKFPDPCRLEEGDAIERDLKRRPSKSSNTSPVIRGTRGRPTHQVQIGSQKGGKEGRIERPCLRKGGKRIIATKAGPS